MLRSLASVSGFTLLSRATGFARDVAMGAALGAGALADAFTIAFRLPNHFRAIFGEGAFNSAYVPTYASTLEGAGAEQAKQFSAQIFTLLLASQIALLVLALAFTPELLGLLAPGVEPGSPTYQHALTMTRITFPYLLCVTLVTLLSGTLNAHGRFAAAAFAPVLLNLSIIACLALIALFPDAGIAASVGVLIAGVLELALMIVATRRAGVLQMFARPAFGADVRRFFKTFLPAVIGSAGVQIALFADTIIGSMLPTGGMASIYYADRIYQLPIGVIGIAAGAVLLPEMSRRLAAGDAPGALEAQNRTIALTIALSAPFFVAFLTIPDLIMAGVFQRGAFTAEAAQASAHVLSAYGIGLLAIVLIRSAVASFQARGDTMTPMKIALGAAALNVALKIALFEPLGAPGLALATAIGAWLNFLLLVFFAIKGGDMRIEKLTMHVAIAASVAGMLLALVALVGRDFSGVIATQISATYAPVIGLLGLMLTGGLAYAGALFAMLALLGVRLSKLKPLRRSASKDEGQLP
jgi:putative peptidoglycan lipid II flippase